MVTGLATTAKRKNDSKLHTAVDSLAHLLAALVTPANKRERAQVQELVSRVRELTGESVGVAFLDQGYTGQEPAHQEKCCPAGTSWPSPVCS